MLLQGSAFSLLSRDGRMIGEELPRHRPFNRLLRVSESNREAVSENSVDLALGDCFAQAPYDSSCMKDPLSAILPLALTLTLG